MMLSNSNLTISTKRAYNSLMNFCNIVNYIYIYFFFLGLKIPFIIIIYISLCIHTLMIGFSWNMFVVLGILIRFRS